MKFKPLIITSLLTLGALNLYADENQSTLTQEEENNLMKNVELIMDTLKEIPTWVMEEIVDKVRYKISETFYDNAPDSQELFDQKTTAIISDVTERTLCSYGLSDSLKSDEQWTPPIQYVAVKKGDETAQHYNELYIHPKDKKHLRFVILATAETNFYLLPLKKREIREHEKKIEHLHPLKYLGTIISDLHMQKQVGQIAESYFKWNEFVENFRERANEEIRNNNMFKHVQGFAHVVNKDAKKIDHLLKKRQYDQLIKYVADIDS